LRLLHERGLGGAEGELRALIIGVGGVRLKAVYQLSEAEIRSDTYGFAREFELVLGRGVDPNTAIELLAVSPCITNARTVAFSTTMK